MNSEPRAPHTRSRALGGHAPGGHAPRSRALRREPVVVGRVVLYGAALLVVLPILFTVVTSLKSTKEFYKNIFGLPWVYEWANYPMAWFEGHIGEYFFTSLRIVSITVVAVLALGSVAGYALAKMHVPHANAIILGLLMLNLFPSESVIMPLYLMLTRLHMAGKEITLILPYTSWGLPFAIYVYRNFVASVPDDLFEAARIDGCREASLFFRVAMPLLLPPTATVIIMTFTGWWGELLWASVSLSTTKLATIPLGILAFQGQYGTNWGPMSAAICIVLLPLIALFFAFQKFYIRGLSEGLIK